MNLKVVLGGAAAAVVVVGGALFLSTQKDDSSGVGTRAAPPPSASAAPVAPAVARFTVDASGKATFLIDAPLEKIKGRWTKYRGNLDVDPGNLTRTTGEIDLDLDDLKTETFGDKDKDTAQTEHAHNWLEIGSDVAAKQREDNRWARFTIKSIESASAAKLAEAPETNGTRVIKVVAKGDMWMHGVTSPKTVKLTATFTGPPAAPTQVRVVTDEPLMVSLKEHDVKPRDVGGKFLSGALEKVGKKIDDQVQISLDLTAGHAGQL